MARRTHKLWELGIIPEHREPEPQELQFLERIEKMLQGSPAEQSEATTTLIHAGLHAPLGDTGDGKDINHAFEDARAASKYFSPNHIFGLGPHMHAGEDCYPSDALEAISNNFGHIQGCQVDRGFRVVELDDEGIDRGFNLDM